MSFKLPQTLRHGSYPPTFIHVLMASINLHRHTFTIIFKKSNILCVRAQEAIKVHFSLFIPRSHKNSIFIHFVLRHFIETRGRFHVSAALFSHTQTQYPSNMSLGEYRTLLERENILCPYRNSNPELLIP